MKKFFAKFKKGNKGGSKVVKGFKKLERKPFKETKLPNIDDFFSKIQAPMDTLCDLSEAIASVNESINTLLETKEFLENKVEKSLKGMISFMRIQAKKSGNDFTLTISDSGVPSLEPKSEPEGLVAKCFECVKKMIESIKEIIEKAPELKDNIQEAVEASKDLPDKAKNDATSSGMNPLESAKAIKNTADNLKYLGGFPNDVIEFINTVKEFVTTMKDAFSGEPEEGGESKG